MRRESFIKKVRLAACAPKHPYNTKTHLALQELRSPLNGLEGVPQPRPLPHLHTLSTRHTLHGTSSRFSSSTMQRILVPARGIVRKSVPSAQAQKDLRRKKDAFITENPSSASSELLDMVGAQPVEKKRGKTGTNTGEDTGEVWRCQSAAK